MFEQATRQRRRRFVVSVSVSSFLIVAAVAALFIILPLAAAAPQLNFEGPRDYLVLVNVDGKLISPQQDITFRVRVQDEGWSSSDRLAAEVGFGDHEDVDIAGAKVTVTPVTTVKDGDSVEKPGRLLRFDVTLPANSVKSEEATLVVNVTGRSDFTEKTASASFTLSVHVDTE